jgi:MFS family permease
LAFNAPAGALVDRIGRARLLMAAATLVVVIGTLILLPAHRFDLILTSRIGVAVGAALVPPALTALIFGIVGKPKFPAQQGRNQAWNHAGNATAET